MAESLALFQPVSLIDLAFWWLVIFDLSFLNLLHFTFAIGCFRGGVGNWIGLAAQVVTQLFYLLDSIWKAVHGPCIHVFATILFIYFHLTFIDELWHFFLDRGTSLIKKLLKGILLTGNGKFYVLS